MVCGGPVYWGGQPFLFSTAHSSSLGVKRDCRTEKTKKQKTKQIKKQTKTARFALGTKNELPPEIPVSLHRLGLRTCLEHRVVATTFWRQAAIHSAGTQPGCGTARQEWTLRADPAPLQVGRRSATGHGPCRGHDPHGHASEPLLLTSQLGQDRAGPTPAKPRS